MEDHFFFLWEQIVSFKLLHVFFQYSFLDSFTNISFKAGSFFIEQIIQRKQVLIHWPLFIEIKFKRFGFFFLFWGDQVDRRVVRYLVLPHVVARHSILCSFFMLQKVPSRLGIFFERGRKRVGNLPLNFRELNQRGIHCGWIVALILKGDMGKNLIAIVDYFRLSHLIYRGVWFNEVFFLKKFSFILKSDLKFRVLSGFSLTSLLKTQRVSRIYTFRFKWHLLINPVKQKNNFQ